ncbi:uncharacterized protein EAF01_011260 [Botrytis porri]|uniref:Uncharacterized protein n=1 Tax=Botrytis porri TaxID=87229 RepID=A0A4Z1KYU9_9HELO|nr:uncharacterized protein EAF01_011260 [Botrytis porri]KAF7886582.1 hypothetical protein EAF01_011260 [Botrytis porri]TGO89755.1 hypothetical protein BPOR_0095g00160 [Botrytis porri]
MPLLDRLRNSLKDRIKRRPQGLHECNFFEDGKHSTQGVQERIPTSCENSRLFEKHTFGYLSPCRYGTLDNVNDDVDDDVDSKESCFTDFSSENSIVRFVSNVFAPGCGTALSPRLQSRSHHIQQQTTLSDQRMSDSQQNNDNVHLDKDSHNLAEDLEVFGSPLKRVKAGSSHPSSGWGMQDQIDSQMREDVERLIPSSRSGSLQSENILGTKKSTRACHTDDKNLERMMIPKRLYLPSENPHRRVGVYDGVFFNHVSNILTFEEDIWDSSIREIG